MKARARNTDPQSSHDAAHEIESSGNAQSHRYIILAFIKRHPEYHYSCREIGYATNLTNGQVHKRMKELEGRGALRMPDALKCPISYRKVTHWRYGHSIPTPALEKDKPAGLECWAVWDNDGKHFIVSEENLHITRLECEAAIFPPSVKRGQRVKVRIPVALPVEGG